jgi:hypothetical protein
MRHYMHNVPGRLRLRNPIFKNQWSHESVRTVLSTLKGIKESEFRTTTGSLTIVYDPEEIQGGEITRALERAGYFDPNQAITNDQYVHDAVSEAGRFITRALFGSAVDVALKGTGLGWISLLI